MMAFFLFLKASTAGFAHMTLNRRNTPRISNRLIRRYIADRFI
ncbi:MAG: hypothetical protein KJ649_04340 [Proteobacteria bacterium]|nr:hypothetical protein [Pseudomonadota bacterium]MBU1744109.1 hypothetical protein [Pseudomonadota bacterium]